MSIHIAAKQGEIADKILLPGDPLRAKFIAENFLEDAVCFNEVRNMFGYTGTYKGERVSVMGTGMGMPSISIYARELVVDYGVKKLIRVGTAGSLNEDVHAQSLPCWYRPCARRWQPRRRYPSSLRTCPGRGR